MLTTNITDIKKVEDKRNNLNKVYKTIIDNIPVLQYNINQYGIILDCNKLTLKTLGYTSKKELIGKPFLTTIYPVSSQEKAKKLFLRWKKQGLIKNEEIQIKTKSGKLLDIILNVATLYDSDGEIISSISTQLDITKRKKAEKVIVDLAKFPSENPNPVIRLGSNCLILYINDSGKKLLKKLDYKKGGRIPKVLSDLIKNDNKKIISKIKTDEIKIGNLFYEFTSVPIKNADYVNIYGKDITNQKRAEKALLKRQEHRDKITSLERTRIERDLHDSVSQTLFSTRLIAEVLPDLWKKDKKEALIQLEKIGVLTKESLSELRRLLLELKPDSIIEEDLEDLIGQLGQSTKLHSDIPVKINTYGKKKNLPPKVKEVFFRITQEALNNIIKHSGASKIKIVIRYLPKKTSLEIEDNGNGFIKKRISKKKLGLYIMEERAKEINASLKIKSNNDGTKLILIYKN